MATESDVDISGAHPYWAYPFSDVAVVHNGQLTNYFQWKRRLERSGHRFQSECDSEIIAVYLAEKMSEGATLEDAMRESLEELDGVFTYICVTKDALGVAKDEMAAKPLVLYEADDLRRVSPPRRSRSARSSTTRSTPTTRTKERCWYGSARRARDQLRRARPRRARRRGAEGLGDRRHLGRVRRPRPLDAADQPRAALADQRAGHHRRDGAEPGREALARRRHPHPLQDHLRRQPRLLRLRHHRRPRGAHQGPRRLVGLREHDVRRRRDRPQRRLAHRRRLPRRRPRRQGPRRRPHRASTRRAARSSCSAAPAR